MTMRVNPVGWIEIYVQDMQRARGFYEGVLQVQLEKIEGPEFAMWAFGMDPEKPGCSGALVQAECASSGGNGTLVYFSCEDCAQEEGRVVEFGGKVEREKMSIGPYGFISLAFDPDGNMIGFHSMK
jgi:predicted enzyme related to lactoylglutathione lyase